MATISERHLAMIESLFAMQNGGVSSYNRNGLKNIIAEITGINIFTSVGYVDSDSRAKNFRRFLSQESNDNVGKVLLKLLDDRDRVEIRRKENDDEYEDKNYHKSVEIREVAQSLISSNGLSESNEIRLSSDIAKANHVLHDIIMIGETVCTNGLFDSSTHEDRINTFFRDLFSEKPAYDEVRDQTLHGLSESKKASGEADVLLRNNGHEVAIFEGLRLDSIITKTIKEHVDKAVANYNALGIPAFVVIYVDTANFADFMNRFSNHMKSYEYPDNITVHEQFKRLTDPNAAIRVARTILVKDEYLFPLHFVLINMPHKKK